jgi:hypothetical protein
MTITSTRARTVATGEVLRESVGHCTVKDVSTRVSLIDLGALSDPRRYATMIQIKRKDESLWEDLNDSIVLWSCLDDATQSYVLRVATQGAWTTGISI